MLEQMEYRTDQHSIRRDDAHEIHLIDLLIVLGRHKRLVIGMPILGIAFAIGVSMLMTPSFSSTAKIMPPQQNQSSGVTAMLGQLGGFAGAASTIAGLKNPNDLYVGILESRTIADNLINQYSLKERYGKKTMDEARIALSEASQIVNGKKDGMISISVSDKDPKFAAKLANAYVGELTKLTQAMAISDASQRRLFFEKQLKEAKEQLANAEVALRTTQQKTGMIQLDGQVHMIISNIAQLRGAIAAKEVQLNAMRTFATAQNPELLRAQEELRALHAQLARLEKSHSSQDDDFMVPIGKIPEAAVEYVRSLRNVKYYEVMFEMLAKQFELAKIDEAKESTLIQLMDEAVPAEKPYNPKRTLFAVVAISLSAALGIVLALLREAYINSRLVPAIDSKWKELKTAWLHTATKRD